MKLFKRFLDIDSSEIDSKLSEISDKMKKNRNELLGAQQKLADIEDEVSKLPKLVEQATQFKELELEEKLRIVPKLEREKRLLNRVDSELQEIEGSLGSFKEHAPDTTYLSDVALNDLPHASRLTDIKTVLDKLKANIQPLVEQIENLITAAKDRISDIKTKLRTDIENEETNLSKAFKEIPSFEGRSGNEIGVQFQALLKEIERIGPKEAQLKTRHTRLAHALRGQF